MFRSCIVPFTFIVVSIQARLNNTDQFGSVQIPIATMTMKLRINESVKFASVPEPISNNTDCNNKTDIDLDSAPSEMGQRISSQDVYPTSPPTFVQSKSNVYQRKASATAPRNSEQQYPTNVPTVQPSSYRDTATIDPSIHATTEQTRQRDTSQTRPDHTVYPTNVPTVRPPRRTLNATFYPKMMQKFASVIEIIKNNSHSL